jgi:hypothetical protein
MGKIMNVSEAEEYSGKWWCAEIATTEKELDRKWRDTSDRVVRRYLDDRSDDPNADAVSKYNIFWANVQILKSALYATPPSPTVTRQYGDAKDDVARTAALILERILTFGLNIDDSDMHQAFKAAVEDRLIPGMGQVWLRYEATTEATKPVIDPRTGVELAPAGSRIVNERAPADYVYWKDFIWSPARTWDEVWWVARRVWLPKARFTARFGKEKYAEIRNSAEFTEKADGIAPKGFRKGKVEIYEVWCRTTRKVHWVCACLESSLEEINDPLGLDNFFPCPRPLFATHTTNDVTPRSDYKMAEDQYRELDTLNSRIAALTKALRVVGVYDSQQAELGKVLTGSELAMIPVTDWAMFAESGGMRKSVDWFPVEQVAGVLEKLMIQRQAVIGQIYELTSISDIMRGSSNPRETAKAQTLKAQYSSVRLQLIQQDVGMFVRHAMRLKAEIVSKHFQPESIANQSQIMFTESAQFAEPAIALLKDYRASEYRIEVSEESLSMADYTAERELRMEYVTAVGQFISQTAQMAQGMPQALPYILRILQWATAAFRGANDIESVFDEAVTAATNQPNPPAQAEQAPPDNSLQVAQIKAQTDMQIAQMDNQTKVQIAQLQAQKDASKLQQESEHKGVDVMEARSEQMTMIEAINKALEPIKEQLAKLTKAETSTEGDD